ncbi:MAG: prolipoprotein diacylglyceryl transferase [Nitrospirae bacterium]|nr:prolipoprotein diacylglyceryl transferase [Nitrospirota bacterium]
MHPNLIELGPFVIRFYGLMYLTAFVVGGWLLGQEIRRKGLPISDDDRWSFLTLVLFAGIAGGRLYYVAFNWEYYSRNPGEIAAIWHGGLAIHGGLIGGALAGWWWVRRHRVAFWALADAAAPAIILGQAFGRFGNFMNGEIHGYPTSLPWGIVFPPTSPAGQQFGAVPVHPAMLYELVINFGIFVLLWRLRTRPARYGFLFLLYLILYAVDRSFVSMFRAEDLMLGPLRAPHVVSAIIILVAGWAILRHRLWKADAGVSPGNAG